MAERARADAQLQESQLELWHATRLSAAGHLAAALAHELNQPLTAVTNSVHAARRLVINGTPERIAKVPEILQEAAEQALRGGQIIARLREFVTRGETEKRSESLIAMIEEASALALTGSTGVDVRVDFHFDPNATHVLANRIQNSAGARQPDPQRISRPWRPFHVAKSRSQRHASTRIWLRSRLPTAGRDWPEMSRRDYSSRSYSSKRKGMGLGLSISRSIVEAHGGKIRVEPDLGSGAVFRSPPHAGRGGRRIRAS